MKIKKLAVMAMSSVMIMSSLTLAGCGNSESSSSSSGGNGKQVTIDMFQFKVENAKELEAAAKQYENENKNVKINIQTVGGGDDYGAALRAKVQSGEEPTIFNIGGPQDVQDWKSRVTDLSAEPWVKDCVDGLLKGVTEDNKIYGMPMSIEGYGFVYNKAIFKDAGIDVNAIKDYASLESAVKTLDSKIKSGALKSKYPKLEAVFEMPAKETWVTGLHASNAALSPEFKSAENAYKAKKVDFKYKDGFKKIIDLEANYSPNAASKGKLNAVDYATQVGQGIAIQRVAMIQQGNWIINDVKKVDEKVASNLGILPIPIQGAKEDVIPVGVPMYWAINSKSSKEQQAAAKKFLNWLYTSDEGKDIVVNKFSFIGPLKSYSDMKPKDSLGQDVQKYVQEGKTTPWVFMGYPSGWGQDVLGKEIQKYLAGQESFDKVISNSQAQWEEMRK